MRTVSFDDGRHEWKEAQGSGFNLYWYSGDRGFAQRLTEAGEEALSLLREDIGAEPGRTIEVYVYGSTAALQGSLIYPQEWTGGLAYTEYGIVALGISTGQLGWGEAAMAHEMAHLVVHQATMNGYGIVLPSWLDEGLAMYAEGELSSRVCLCAELCGEAWRARLCSKPVQFVSGRHGRGDSWPTLRATAWSTTCWSTKGAGRTCWRCWGRSGMAAGMRKLSNPCMG